MTTGWLFLFVLCRLLRRVAGCCNGLRVLLILVDGPVEHVVVLETFADEEIAEDLSKVRVVRLVIETQRARVVQVDGELIGEPATEYLGGRRHFLFHDPVVLLLLGGSLQSLPWEGAAAEVQHDISQGFHIITAGLFWGDSVWTRCHLD